MLTLGIETAADVCAVALLDGDDLLVRSAVHVPRAHGRRLAPLVAEALAHAGRDAADLDLVAVSAGPGSYTGLRIGMSTAKGLCLSTGAGLAAVPTLRALADGVGGAVVVALPSRRGEVYAALYDGDAEVREPTALALDDLAGWLPPAPPGGFALGGPGAGRIADADPERPWRRLALVPDAVAVARRGQAEARAGRLADLAAAEPAYLKPVAAVRPRGIFPG
ncbi:tRNA (adenosine(37)-N6)-threonylcarbamoyltransferase complex dimerization subunit type 1 TsaB [Rubrivirga sp. S365]|uniref:tRNA (Adenosine(37)-N6)-threonylcarbamoyltransferase complex dimerization subunit type 1 TsaB n=1 Tax=Rubrivirga litoralis TaxID=3075598 RepID=A0ABU3BRI9_9BACT|nr:MULTISPECIES: tRNA (adenosine(37)-N6)-threonylcarbamoyltransferase complex dimerization subunit type 1 TsaB [unclassified Rubrivirga]MDT0631865.1 tRNA (adenosine(37)-N6)-threonylcarbamoyltransferase complex dimerization subunit type 1 TsaB [Rubrivirga sp. F394]MDT7857918.1 tRNA (adenosine(37)-N6)-threonylcarbamoyltransferase complex dimerization subunit type 1 TsaB [Rubrivirga sp. S365]